MISRLISVLLPVFNSEKYISESIQSILNQTYTKFELLILDDCSTDKTLKIINRFKDERIKIFTSERNFGIVHQLNKGIDNSKGEFIARMDADDISYHERFNKQIEYLNLHPKIDVLGTFAEKFGDESGLIEYKYNNPEQISFLLNFYCYLLHPTVMMRKKIFEKHKYSNKYMLAEDYGLWCQVNNGKNLHILDEVLLKYRLHNEQTNKSEVRLQIQYNSVLQVKKDIRFNRIFGNIIFNENLNIITTNYYISNRFSGKINYFQIVYLKMKIKKLFIKLELVNLLSAKRGFFY